MDFTGKQFGVLIAFLLPGFIFLWIVSQSSPLIASWFANAQQESVTAAKFLFVFVASLCIGLIVSAIRCALIDSLLKLIGLKPPEDGLYSALSDPEKYKAFQGAVENHYRYYQYYSNSLVAILAAILLNFISKSDCAKTWYIIGVSGVCIVLLWGARDALSKHYKKITEILKAEK